MFISKQENNEIMHILDGVHRILDKVKYFLHPELKHYSIIHDKVYENTLPLLRYMFEENPLPYHEKYDTMKSRLFAECSMRYIFTDMIYFKEKYDSWEEYDDAIDSIKFLFMSTMTPKQVQYNIDRLFGKYSLKHSPFMMNRGKVTTTPTK